MLLNFHVVVLLTCLLSLFSFLVINNKIRLIVSIGFQSKFSQFQLVIRHVLTILIFRGEEFFKSGFAQKLEIWEDLSYYRARTRGPDNLDQWFPLSPIHFGGAKYPIVAAGMGLNPSTVHLFVI